MAVVADLDDSHVGAALVGVLVSVFLGV